MLIPIITYDPRSQKTLTKVRLEIYCHCHIENLDHSSKYEKKIEPQMTTAKTVHPDSLLKHIAIQQAKYIKIICGFLWCLLIKLHFA